MPPDHALETDPLTDYIRMFASNARALSQLLRNMAVLFTYDDTSREALPAVWRHMMATVLDALEGGTDLLEDHHCGPTVPSPVYFRHRNSTWATRIQYPVPGPDSMAHELQRVAGGLQRA